MPSVTAAHPQLATSFTWGQQLKQHEQQQQQRQQQPKEREASPAGADFKQKKKVKKKKKAQPKQQPQQQFQPPPQQQQAPIASPGSHGAAMQAPRQSLKMSPPSSNKSLTPSVPGLSLSKRSWHNHPEMHLWGTSDRGKGGPGAAEREGDGGAMRLPQQSPVRRAEWWRRPPSPLAAHMRPLWDSQSGSAISGSGDFPEAMKSMASGEGEAAAGGDTRRGGSQVRPKTAWVVYVSWRGRVSLG